MDPGKYTIEQTSGVRCVIRRTGEIQNYLTNFAVRFEIQRIVEIFCPKHPGELPGIAGVGLHFQNTLRLLSGDESTRMDLWHLMQLPVPATVGAFVRNSTEPEIYFNRSNASDWRVENGCLTWQTDGKRMSKLGLSASALAGPLFAIREGSGCAMAWLWNVPAWREAEYIDAPPGTTYANQVAQYWDGFGFCEVEYHSPGASITRPEISDTSELVCLTIPSADREAYSRMSGLPLQPIKP
jgi:hypothetical protein